MNSSKGVIMTEKHDFNETIAFKPEREDEKDIREILTTVYDSLEEKYLLSGDPTYITAHNGARKLIRAVDRDEIIEELLNNYIND